MRQQWTEVNGMLYHKRILHLIPQVYDGKNMHVRIFNNLNHINVKIHILKNSTIIVRLF